MGTGKVKDGGMCSAGETLEGNMPNWKILVQEDQGFEVPVRYLSASFGVFMNS